MLNRFKDDPRLPVGKPAAVTRLDRSCVCGSLVCKQLTLYYANAKHLFYGKFATIPKPGVRFVGMKQFNRERWLFYMGKGDMLPMSQNSRHCISHVHFPQECFDETGKLIRYRKGKHTNNSNDIVWETDKNGNIIEDSAQTLSVPCITIEKLKEDFTFLTGQEEVVRRSRGLGKKTLEQLEIELKAREKEFQDRRNAERLERMERKKKRSSGVMIEDSISDGEGVPMIPGYNRTPIGVEYCVSLKKERFKFNCAHFIAFKGFRERLHGHNYQVGVKLWGERQSDGYVLDFGVVKKVCRGDM
uniref:6-pyruvoyltetrahydropterin synthase n=1 Tax=Mucochytrium quahogii TaxID=96639 RepID=A0A7S2RP79_9STRA